MALAGCAVTIFVDVCKQSKIELETCKVVAEAQKLPNSPKLAEVIIVATVSAKTKTI